MNEMRAEAGLQKSSFVISQHKLGILNLNFYFFRRSNPIAHKKV